MAFDHDCGRGCACNRCGGCIRAGTVCKIYPSTNASFAELAELMQPVAERVGLDARVTINVSELSLAEAGILVAAMLRDPVAIPADKALQTVTLHLKDVTLAEVVDALGLVRG